MSTIDNTIFYGIILCAFIASRLPILGKMLCVLYTMIHETAHAFAAIISGSKIISIDLFHDTSGIAKTATTNSLATFIIVIAGYPLSAFFSFFSAWLIKNNRYEMLLIILLIIASTNLLLWVRNKYGIVWLIIFTCLSGFVLYQKDFFHLQVLSIFFSAILFLENIIKSFTVFYLSLKNPAQSGDARILYQTTGIPSIFWASLFLLVSIYTSYLSVLLFLT